MTWTLARRAERLEPSAIREILKLAERPGVISLAGGLPAAEGFPVEAVRDATARVLAEAPREALQYAASEGFGPLREWVAGHLRAQGLGVEAGQVLITTGSQQGLDLVGKVLLDAGSTVAVETPTYLGALQAFAPCEPRWLALDDDGAGPRPQAMTAARGARFAYLLPTFHNPSGRCLDAARRHALVDAALDAGVAIVEDDPYGALWFDDPPPPPLAARAGDGAVYLGSFSKVLAPGLRHLPALRWRYRERRDAMHAALARHLPSGCRWTPPHGGMFFWVELPAGLDAARLLPRAVDAGVAFVPGAPFFCETPQPNTMRLSFATKASRRWRRS
ncbi:MAG: PLP-dependent aminotransferase family protein [Burkholderiaceae bacterium]|nr:PLP-dependent aminotransferase family protein [Burkholderiaceae bacterium]